MDNFIKSAVIWVTKELMQGMHRGCFTNHSNSLNEGPSGRLRPLIHVILIRTSKRCRLRAQILHTKRPLIHVMTSLITKLTKTTITNSKGIIGAPKLGSTERTMIEESSARGFALGTGT